jgi:hypothetical protein
MQFEVGDAAQKKGSAFSLRAVPCRGKLSKVGTCEQFPPFAWNLTSGHCNVKSSDG